MDRDKCLATGAGHLDGALEGCAKLVGLFDVLSVAAVGFNEFGVVRGREGTASSQVCPHGHFPCADGNWVAIACTSDKMWARMAVNVLERPDLAESHPKTADRLAARALIDGVVEAFTRSHPMTEIVRLCTGGDVPCGPINTIADIFADPHFAARQTIARIADETLGEIAVPNVLPHLSQTPGEISHLGPTLGDWNRRITDILADESQLRPRRNRD